MSSSVLITGATGFIGSQLVAAMIEHGRRVRVLVRTRARAEALWGQQVEITEHDLTSADRDGHDACKAIDVVFHLAGHAHAEDEGSDRSDRLHQQVTVEGTRRLLSSAAAHGVERFLFLSSVKAIGERTELTAQAGDSPNPQTAYGRAKRDAELMVLAARGIVLRAPLVYGPGVKGNLHAMMGAIAAGRFPPIPKVDHRRSMVDVKDVVAALRFLEHNERARQRVFLVTDGEPYSTRRIYEAISAELGRKIPRWSLPLPLLRAGAHVGDLVSKVTGRSMPLTTERLNKLFGNAHYSNQALIDLGFRSNWQLETSLPEMIRVWQAGDCDKKR